MYIRTTFDQCVLEETHRDPEYLKISDYFAGGYNFAQEIVPFDNKYILYKITSAGKGLITEDFKSFSTFLTGSYTYKIYPVENRFVCLRGLYNKNTLKTQVHFMLKDSFSKNSNYYVDLTSLDSKLVISTPTYEALCNVNNNYVLYCSVTNQRSTNISDICRNFVFINSDISKIHESYRELSSLQETNVYGLGSIGDNSLVCLGYNQNAPSFKYTANLYYYSDIINSDVYIKTSIEVPDSFTNFGVTTFPNRFDNILFFINGEPYLCIDGYSCKKLSEEEALGFFSKDIGHYYLAQRYGDFVISYNYTYEINELKLYKLNADKQTTTFLGNLPHPETTNGILGLVGNELYLTADEDGIYKVNVVDLINSI